jgi:biotin transport system permease protein
LALLIVGAASVFLQRWLLALGIVLVVIIAAYLSAGIRPRMLWAQIKPMIFLLIFVAAMQALARRWHDVAAIPGMLACLVLLAALVTLTTRTSDLVSVIIRIATPLQRFGVDPERIGVFLLLGIRCVPVASGLASRVREAQLARCDTFSLKAFAVPLVVSALRDADAMGEALEARGFDD